MHMYTFELEMGFCNKFNCCDACTSYNELSCFELQNVHAATVICITKVQFEGLAILVSWLGKTKDVQGLL